MILDAEETKRLAGEGMARASQSLSELDKSIWRGAILKTGEKHAKFSADDVWVELHECGYDTSKGSALGPLFRELAKDGSIEPTGEFIRSIRPATHGRPLPTWRLTDD